MTFKEPQERKIANRMTNLEACTDEELEQKLARVLAYLGGNHSSVLSEARGLSLFLVIRGGIACNG